VVLAEEEGGMWKVENKDSKLCLGLLVDEASKLRRKASCTRVGDVGGVEA